MIVTSIPLPELKADLAESMLDIRMCQIALRLGMERTRKVDVHDRLAKNADIVNIILDEVERRIMDGDLVADTKGILIEVVRRKPK